MTIPGLGDHEAHPGHQPHEHLSRRPRRHGIVFVGLAVLLVAILGVGGAVGISRLIGAKPADYPGPGDGQAIVQVATGATATDIGATLQAAQVVKSVAAFAAAARSDRRSLGLQPGYYRLKLHMKATAALTLMLDPASRLRGRVTIPEGTSLKRTLELIAANTTGISLQSLKQAAANPNALGLPAYAQGHLDGFLFPATYDIEPYTDAVSVLSMLTQRFQVAAADTSLEQGAAAVHLTPLQVVTLASIIERESAGGADRGKVARVFENRLARGMPLGSEATIRYALGYPTRELTRSDIAVDSPYNTYRVVGVPPGPICSPGEATIEAVLHPTPGPWLFFFTRKDGHTVFSTTEAEFEASQRNNG